MHYILPVLYIKQLAGKRYYSRSHLGHVTLNTERWIHLSLKIKSKILFKTPWKCWSLFTISIASNDPQPFWLRQSDSVPVRGCGVLIIVTWNKITIFCLPLLAASSYWRSKLILISIVLTLCFHVQQTKHLQAGPLFAPTVFLAASTPCLFPAEAKNYNRQEETRNFDHKIKQYDWCCWKRTKKILSCYFVTLVDVSLAAMLSLIPAVSCCGWRQIVRHLKEAKPKFTCK